MKKLLSCLIYMVFSSGLLGQVVSVSIAPTLSNALYFKLVAGGHGSSAKFGKGATIVYLNSQDNRFSIGFGINYQHSNLEIIPAPGVPIETHQESINVLAASFKTIYNLNNSIFFTVNPLIGLQLPSESQKSVDKQTGLGLSFSGGKRFEVAEHLSLSLEPIIWIYNIIPFIDQLLPERLTVVGIKAGFSIIQ